MGLFAVIWNGQFGSASRATTVQLDSAEAMTWCNAALIPGTAQAPSPFAHGGADKPRVQLFANRPNGGGVLRWEYAYDQTYPTAGGSWSARDPKDEDDAWNHDYDHLYAFPYYLSECSSDSTYEIQRQHIVLNMIEDKARAGRLSSSHALNVVSDALVPIQEHGQKIGCSTSWGGYVTNTGDDPSSSEEAMTWQKYWTLLGVILGSPPFALNGWEGFELEPFSNIEIGSSETQNVTCSEQRDRQLTFSAGVTVSEGFEKLGLDIENELEMGYKYGWESGHESSQSWTRSFGKTFGTEGDNTDDPENLGRFGWAIFNVPEMLVQDYAIYSYTCSVNGPMPDPSNPTLNGTYLNQDIHSVEVLPDSSSVFTFDFLLEKPGSDEDSIPGLMSGMAGFSNSQDLDFWDDPGWLWETPPDGLWTVLLGGQTDQNPGGEIKIEQLTFVPGSPSYSKFCEKLKDIDTHGYTTDVDINDNFSIGEKCFLGGFKLNLKAGYDSAYKQEISTLTSWDQDVQASLGMKTAKDETDPDAVKILTVQPYLLKATDENAPWIPNLYRGQRPWCITWKSEHTNCVEGRGGRSCPVPDHAVVRVVGGNGGQGGDASPASGEATVISDCMYFDKGLGAAPGAASMGAEDFDPAKGATVQLNGFVYATSPSKGRWTRHGDVWRYKTKESAKPGVLLKLDFGSQSWSVTISRVDLSGHFGPSGGGVRVALTLNGTHSSYSEFKPDIRAKWALKAPEPTGDAIALTRYWGEYDSSRNEGEVDLKGTLPKNPGTFGDLSFSLNGRQIDLPLTTLDDYEEAVTKGRDLVYDREGVHAELDFGQGTWKATFKKDGFHPLLAPRLGKAKIRILLGGTVVYSQDHTIGNYTAKLTFGS